MTVRLVAFICAVLFASPALAALADSSAPAPAATQAPAQPANPLGVPSSGMGGLEQAAIDALGNFVKSAFGWNDNEAYGVVTYYRGYDLQVRMQLNRYRDIHLHRGTVINPRGWTLSPGQTIDVHGRGQSDGSLYADSIVVLKH